MTNDDEVSESNYRLQLTSYRDVPLEIPDDGYSTWTATLTRYQDDPEHFDTVGVAWVVLFRDARWDARFYERMDEVDTDMELIAGALCVNARAASEDLFESLEAEGGDLVIIDRVGIEKPFRGKGLAFMLVDAAARALSPEGVIALLPMPAGKEKSTKAIAKLQSHWAAAGFIEHKHGVFVRASVPIRG